MGCDAYRVCGLLSNVVLRKLVCDAPGYYWKRTNPTTECVDRLRFSPQNVPATTLIPLLTDMWMSTLFTHNKWMLFPVQCFAHWCTGCWSLHLNFFKTVEKLALWLIFSSSAQPYEPHTVHCLGRSNEMPIRRRNMETELHASRHRRVFSQETRLCTATAHTHMHKQKHNEESQSLRLFFNELIWIVNRTRDSF